MQRERSPQSVHSRSRADPKSLRYKPEQCDLLHHPPRSSHRNFGPILQQSFSKVGTRLAPLHHHHVGGNGPRAMAFEERNIRSGKWRWARHEGCKMQQFAAIFLRCETLVTPRITQTDRQTDRHAHTEDTQRLRLTRSLVGSVCTPFLHRLELIMPSLILELRLEGMQELRAVCGQGKDCQSKMLKFGQTRLYCLEINLAKRIFRRPGVGNTTTTHTTTRSATMSSWLAPRSPYTFPRTRQGKA